MSKYSKSGQSSDESFHHQMVSEGDEKYNSKFTTLLDSNSDLKGVPIDLLIKAAEQFNLEHPEDVEQENYVSEYDIKLSKYVSKQLLNGHHSIDVDNNESDFVNYDGDFVKGIREGYGFYNQVNLIEGQIDFQYNGNFKNNLPEGKGVARWVENGSIIYTIEGNFVNGLPDSTQLCSVTVEYLQLVPSMPPATKKTMTVMVNYESFEKPSSAFPNNLLDIYWQGVFELKGIMTDENNVSVNGRFDIHGNILSQNGGRRSKKLINKKKIKSKKRI
jgi:hypothetical protein